MKKYHLISFILFPFFVFSQTDSLKVKDSLLVEKQIKEVTIVGQKKLYEQKPDRLVFNVENSIMASGGDALDALKITPNIRVGNDGRISMIGKDQMSVMVDDRIIPMSGDQLADYLKSIPSGNIKSIEIITTPPAKYEAEGSSGIINIILKKAKNDSWNLNLRANALQGYYLSGRAGMDFNLKKGKWAVLANVSGGNSNSMLKTNNIYEYPAEFWKSSFFFKNFTDMFSFNIGANYQITGNFSAGIYFNRYANTQNTENTSRTYIYDNSNLETENAQYYSEGNSEKHYKNSSLNFNLKQKLDTLGKVINFDFDYFGNSNNTNNPFYTTNFYYKPGHIENFFTTNNSRPNLKNYSTRLDFNMPYKWGTLNYGGKYSSSKNNSFIAENFYEILNNANELYLSQQNHFKYKENYEALYLSFEKKISEHWQAKAGLRMEAMQTEGISETPNEETQTNKTDYVELFPTAYISYNIENHSFSLSYSRRINRPNFNWLNPARQYQNLNIYFVGNPFLQPSFSQNFSLNYSYKNLLTSTVWLDRITDGSGNLTTYDNQNNIITITENYYNSIKTGLTENLNMKITNWWNLSSNITFWYAKTSAHFQYIAPEYSGWGAYFSANNYFNFNKEKTFFGELNFWYASPTKEQQNDISSSSALSASLRYLLLNKKLQISLTANDIFGTSISRGKNVTQGVLQTFRQNNDNQSVRFSVSYKFGNQNIYVHQNEGSNAEEKQRAN
jgi:hypothetical protein